MGYETRVTQYTEGTLNIDIVERARDQLVWEGALVGKITENIMKDIEATSNNAVHEIFKRYPYGKGGLWQPPAAAE